ncbi:hypothetical protein ISN44_As06g026410 [Arabidopsis suecica]|uniref:Uncharacterized protein n=1 Tax=Arabidopsis suecica TaxID=45249 RepID=A0A8T2CG51_ARASU|nr:hypothetical protein ISN44_As06g026410 [Arabidopsis suecica]KAG7598375.1 hypothetical protein ISN44_As06g026410 [Arabidopsis suecica]
MSPDGELAPVDSSAEVSAKTKTTQLSRSWISIDVTGQKTVLDVDKHVIMHRVQIHARDLRILDPNLFYPSAILGRERAIFLNLEVGTFSVFSSRNAWSRSNSMVNRRLLDDPPAPYSSTAISSTVL